MLKKWKALVEENKDLKTKLKELNISLVRNNSISPKDCVIVQNPVNSIIKAKKSVEDGIHQILIINKRHNEKICNDINDKEAKILYLKAIVDDILKLSKDTSTKFYKERLNIKEKVNTMFECAIFKMKSVCESITDTIANNKLEASMEIITKIKANLSGKINIIKKLEQDNNDLKYSLQNLTSNIEEFKGKISKRDKEIKDLNSKIEFKEIEVNQLMAENEKKIQELNKNINEAKDIRKSLENSQELLSNEIKILKEKIIENEKLLKDKDNNSQCEKNNPESNDKILNKDNNVGDLIKQLDEKDEAIIQLKTMYEELVKKLDMDRRKATFMNLGIKDTILEKQVKDLQNKLDNQTKELNEIKKELEKKSEELEESDEIKKSFEGKCEELKKRIKELEAKLEEARKVQNNINIKSTSIKTLAINCAETIPLK